MFGCLRGDATEIFGRDFNFNDIINLATGTDFFGVLQRNFNDGIGDDFDDAFERVNVKSSVLTVKRNFYFGVRLIEIFFVCDLERGFDCLEHDFGRNFFFGTQIFQRAD